MDNAAMSIFIHELRNQCLYSETSFKVFNQSIQQNVPTAVFFAAQSTLLSASHIACLLWPTSSRARKRGEEIRKALQIADKHPLNNSRVKSLWDKSDEKLERWITDTKGGNVIFDHLGSPDEFDPQRFSEKNVYRMYDPKTSIFFFRGDGYNMQAMANAIADIYARTNALHKAFFPEHHKQQENVAETKEVKTEEKPKKKPKKKKDTVKKPAAKKLATKKPAKKATKKAAKKK